MPITCVKKHSDRAPDLAFREILADVSDHNTSTPRSDLELAIPSLPPLHVIDDALKNIELEVDFETIMHAMLYMLSGSNRQLRDIVNDRVLDLYNDESACDGQAFIARAISVVQALACRQRFHSLTASEVAAIAAGGMADCVAHLDLGEVIETCGMGADKGFGKSSHGAVQYKTINVSTLSALVLSSIGLPAIKHGSYGNTSKVASSNAADMLEIPRHFESYELMMEYFCETGFLYLEAGVFKTVHDLSHMIKHETVNHILGPMSVPLSSNTILHKLIGLNGHMDPRVIVEAYNILHERNYQAMGGIVAICGLSSDAEFEMFDLTVPNDLYRSTVVDEISPHGTLLAVGCGGDYFGQVVIELNDFGECSFTEAEIMIPNEEEAVKVANMAALTDEDSRLSDYLAANAALALIAYSSPNIEFITNRQYRQEELRKAYDICRAAITTGEVKRYLQTISPNLEI
jgi:anthranilate phosphoribosyltransferase